MITNRLNVKDSERDMYGPTSCDTACISIVWLPHGVVCAENGEQENNDPIYLK